MTRAMPSTWMPRPAAPGVATRGAGTPGEPKVAGSSRAPGRTEPDFSCRDVKAPREGQTPPQAHTEE